MVSPDKQPCPICGNTRSSVVHHTTYPEHRYPGTFTLRRCDCGLMFNSPRLDDGELARLYGQNYYFFHRRDSREFNRIATMYQRTIALIDSQALVKRSIDIGCGRGYFPAVLRALGWEAAGIEISPQAAEDARARFALDVFTGTVEQYASSAGAGQFPVVTAIDVIEHVSDPETFTAAAATIVAGGGLLIIDTPNAGAHNISTQGVAWKGFNPFHIYLFTIGNLTGLLQRHGLSVVRSFSYGNMPAGISIRGKIAVSMKSIGLLGPAARAYFTIKDLTSFSGWPQRHIPRAVRRIMSEPPYTAWADADGPLAADASGDNIVVIAQKP